MHYQWSISINRCHWWSCYLHPCFNYSPSGCSFRCCGVKHCAIETALTHPQLLVWSSLCKCFFFLSYGKLFLCILGFHPVIPQWFYIFHGAFSLVWVFISKFLRLFVISASVFNHCPTFCRCGCMSFCCWKTNLPLGRKSHLNLHVKWLVQSRKYRCWLYIQCNQTPTVTASDCRSFAVKRLCAPISNPVGIWYYAIRS